MPSRKPLLFLKCYGDSAINNRSMLEEPAQHGFLEIVKTQEKYNIWDENTV